MSSKAKIYLYKEGNECVSLTGGWGRAFNNGNHSDILTLYDEYMQSSSPTTNSWVTRSTTNKFNFNKYKELTLDYEISSKTTLSIKSAMDILSNTGTWTILDSSIVKNNMFSTQNLDIGSYTETLDISDLNSLYYANLRSSWGGVRFKNLYLTTNENTILINSQDDNSINFSCNTFDNLISITKAEVYINNQLSKSYTSNFDNLTYDIDNSLLSIRYNKISIKVTYTQGDDIYETVEEVLTHTNTVNNLSTSSSLKELIDRQELLTNSIEVQKNTLKSLLESKNVEVSEVENKLSILIQKVNELSESPIKWIYKDGVEKVEITSFTSGHSDYTYLPITKKEGYIDLSITNRANTFVHLSTKDKIDLTNYSKLKFEIDTNEVYSLGYVGNTLSIDSVFNGTSQPAVLLINKVGRNVFELDIKNISGEHYVCHSIQRVSVGSISSKVYKIWLEK